MKISPTDSDNSAMPVRWASLYVMSTYEANLTTDRLFDQHQFGAEGEVEHHTLHDCRKVFLKWDAPDNPTLGQVAELHRQAQAVELPQACLKGSTTALALLVADPADRECIAEVLQTPVKMLDGGMLTDHLAIYEVATSAADGGDCRQPDLVMVCDAQGADNLSQLLDTDGDFWLFESMRHAVMYQFVLYEGNSRQPHLNAGRALRERLSDVGIVCNSFDACAGLHVHHSTGNDPATIVRSAQGLAEEYRVTRLAESDVYRVKSSLHTNIGNAGRSLSVLVDQMAWSAASRGRRMLERRLSRLSLFHSQAEADLALVEPVLEAAACLLQLCHGQLLAQLTATEQLENETRSRLESKDRVWRYVIAGIGLWLGLSQTILAYLAVSQASVSP